MSAWQVRWLLLIPAPATTRSNDDLQHDCHFTIRVSIGPRQSFIREKLVTIVSAAQIITKLAANAVRHSKTGNGVDVDSAEAYGFGLPAQDRFLVKGPEEHRCRREIPHAPYSECIKLVCCRTHGGCSDKENRENASCSSSE